MVVHWVLVPCLLDAVVITWSVERSRVYVALAVGRAACQLLFF
jgi:hypothetical protein